ncbi:S8 family serine peptidase [Aromatoleum anaerobium]|uniref:S8 family serine peptidase n=1 Tax=Aromatoleum anaerobium TaxID=182180 RepID=A0ABX1PJV6_9RHOO|nr:S8 family serine peptidase [Aromatoleum anaerobium]MCK0506838.1 S8 family serine peptidase [Aromatoleum anaerobium]
MNDTTMNVRPHGFRRVSLQRRNVSLVLALALAGSAGSMAAYGANDTPAWVPGRILVQPRPGLPEAALEKILKAHGGKSIERIEAIGVHVVQLPPNVSEKAVAALLSKNKHLKFAELDMLLEPAGSVNDPYFSKAWHLPKIQAPTAWDASTGAGVTVAILDSGVDASHPDLAGKLVSGWNFYDGNSNTTDVNGHGTKVAGTVAAATNNATGVAAVAGAAKIMPVRVSSSSGSGSLSAIASGLTWAADRGARVANLSFYGVSTSSTIVSAAQYMKNKGGLVTVSAGNYGTETTFASTDTMIIVSATDSNDAKTSWSSYGNYVDLAAPGAGIWTTANGGGYGSVSGTSFSSPVTAGVVALMMAVNPTLGASQVQQLLQSTAKDLGAAGWDKYYGYGLVNAAAAVQAAKGSAPSDSTAPSVSVSSPTSGSTVKGLVAINVSAADNVGISRVDLLVNGSKLASDTTAPYGFSWDSTTVADGNATLTAYAYDAVGNYASSSAAVKVANAASASTDTVVPTATISSPTNGANIGSKVTVSASASDNVGVASLSLYIDGQLKSTVNGSSLSYLWNTRKESGGTHTVQVVAKDTAGNAATRSISVTK